MINREKMLEHSWECLESQVKEQPSNLKEVLVNKELYDWLSKRERRVLHNYGVAECLLPKELLYERGDRRIPFTSSATISSWRFIYEDKEMEQMIQLTNVTFNGLHLSKASVVGLHSEEYQDIHHYTTKTQEVIIEPSGVDAYTLKGALAVLRYDANTMSDIPPVHLKAVNNDKPWISYTIEGIVGECSTQGAPLKPNYIERIVLRIKEVQEHVDEELLPKVKLEVTEKDAAYLQALILKDKNTSKYIEYEFNHKNKLLAYIRSQTKGVQE